MRFRVYLLRDRGRRLRWRDVANTTPAEGELLTHVRLSRAGAPTRVATLRDPRAPAGRPLLPALYEPVLVLVGPMALRLRGIERAGGKAVLQEWFCEASAPER